MEHESAGWREACRQALSAGRVAEALTLLAAQAAEGDGAARLRQARLAWRLGHLELAETALLRGVVLSELGVDGLTHLAALALDGARPSEAARYLELCLHADAEDDADPPPTLRAPPPAPRGGSPKVGVGLPVYSGGDLLAGSIEAVLAQTYEDLELVVLDVGDDQKTVDICRHYAGLDPRVRHVRTGERLNYVGTTNFRRVMQLTTSPYFFWASYDDRHAPDFVERCLTRLEAEPDLALVYGKSMLEDAEGRPMGPGRDDIATRPGESRGDAFLRVFRMLSMCNAWYGLWRRSVLDQMISLETKLYRAFDNLMLAEACLYGRVEQRPEVLFTRRFTRRAAPSYAEQNVDVIRAHHPAMLREGLTFPMVRLTVAHVEAVERAQLPRDEASRLTAAVLEIGRQRFHPRMTIECDRAVQAIADGHHHCGWDGVVQPDGHDALEQYRMVELVRRLEEASLVYPGRRDIRAAIETLHARLAQRGAAATP